MKKTFFVFAVMRLLCVGANAANLTIDGDTPWLVMRTDYANMPIQKAIRDAERDWYKVFGYPPVIFRDDSIPSRWDGPVIVFGSAENTRKLVDSQIPEGKELHRLFLSPLSSGNPALVATGSDTRGTVFAIYTFCQKVLGIDPMYIFTDHKPKRRSEISLAADFEIKPKKPTFEYRGWFINDEELHDGMHRDPLGGNVIAIEWMDKILETLLRCKGNMIIPESSPYPDATVYDLCQRRDVVVTHHHISPTGLNMMNWPRRVPFSFITHKEILIDAWTKAVKAQQDKKVAWIIGFRGESDGAFWNSDRAAPADDVGRAAVIAEAMQTQTDIIRAVDPEGDAVGTLRNIRISNVVAEVAGEDKSRFGPIMIAGIPGHYVENVILENINISYPGGGTREDAERVVPEDIARYPEQFFFDVLPAWGAYIRHARNIEFKNVVMQTRSADARKKIILDDVEGFVEN